MVLLPSYPSLFFFFAIAIRTEPRTVDGLCLYVREYIQPHSLCRWRSRSSGGGGGRRYIATCLSLALAPNRAAILRHGCKATTGSAALTSGSGPSTVFTLRIRAKGVTRVYISSLFLSSIRTQIQLYTYM